MSDVRKHLKKEKSTMAIKSDQLNIKNVKIQTRALDAEAKWREKVENVKGLSYRIQSKRSSNDFYINSINQKIAYLRSINKEKG